MSLKACAHCSKTFRKDPRNTWAYWERAKYCCQECAGLANSIRAAAVRLSMADTFAKWVKKTDGCWGWTGATDKDGYGIFTYEGKTYRAPKVALALDGRPVPPGKLACHHCDNPICIRPDHLYPGTQLQNMADAVKRNRLRPRTKLTADQVREIRAAAGTHDAIAASYGVARATISLILEGKTWRNLA